MKRVVWEIDVEADSAQEAADKALAIQRNPDSCATVFDVKDRDGKIVRVDAADRVTNGQTVRCPRCGEGRLAETDLVEGYALIEAIRPDGTVEWAGETRMDWDSQRPAHCPPQIVCLACNHRLTFHDMIWSARRSNEGKRNEERKAS